MEPLIKLLHYAIQTNLIDKIDYDYAFNRLARALDLAGDYQPYNTDITITENIDALLKPLLDHAAKKKQFSPDTIAKRDLFESMLMDSLTPHPSVLNARFQALKNKSATLATDDFYKRSQDSNYIKIARIAKNKFYRVPSDYGDIEITINLSKPEKDPKDIAKQPIKNNYPKCLLCKENVGYYGHVNHPGRSHHRIIKLNLNQEPFYMQYSPYVYYNEHAIVLHENHIPMDVQAHTFKRLFDFVDQFPHYFLGSNAGLPVVGGSILNHEHYQGGRAYFPIDKAKSFYTLTHQSITYELLHWPLSVIRMRSSNRKKLIAAAEHLRVYFENYSDESIDLIAKTKTQHNAITPILRQESGTYILTIALRNNRTTKQHPHGIFHPHKDVHHIKKENIGLIEVMGLAILPGRLNQAFIDIEAVLKGEKAGFLGDRVYQPWIKKLKTKMPNQNLHQYIAHSAGKIFIRGLEDCGIFKQTPAHQDKFIRFLKGCLACL